MGPPHHFVTCIEDWARAPGDDRDLHARFEVLELRAAAHKVQRGSTPKAVSTYRGQVLVVSPNTAKLAEVLIERFGDAVTDTELSAAAFGDPMPSSSSSSGRLRRQMSHLRTRLRELDLTVQHVRRCGYQLQRR